MTKSRHFAHLCYPLKAESLVAMALFYLLGNALFAISGIEPEFDSTSFWSVVHWSSITLFLILLFYYGLDIIEQSARGESIPPTLDPNTIFSQISESIQEHLSFNFSSMNYRLLRQQLMIMLFLGTSEALARAGHEWSALYIRSFFILVLPASVGINAIAENKLQLFNPVRLVQFALTLKHDYLMATVALLLAYASYQLAVSASPLAFQLFLPLSLYWSIVMFRALGAGIYQNREHFYEEVDFHAEKKHLEALSHHIAPLNETLMHAYELARAHKPEEAVVLLRRYLQAHSPEYFGLLFSYMSHWPFSQPTLKLLQENIPQCIDARQYMQTLAYCEWALQRDTAFTLASAQNLLELAEQAVTKVQCHTVIRLLENHRETGPETRHAILKQAAGLAINHLKDEQLFNKLQQQILSLKQVV